MNEIEQQLRQHIGNRTDSEKKVKTMFYITCNNQERNDFS